MCAVLFLPIAMLSPAPGFAHEPVPKAMVLSARAPASSPMAMDLAPEASLLLANASDFSPLARASTPNVAALEPLA